MGLRRRGGQIISQDLVAEEECLQQDTRKQWLLKTVDEIDTHTGTETDGHAWGHTWFTSALLIKADLHRRAHTQNRCFCPSWFLTAPRGQPG